MKTAFSTLGCPQWSFSEILSTAVDLGFDGVEFRGVEREIYVPHVKEFTEDILKTKEKLKSLNIEAAVFTSGAVLSDGEETLKEAYDYINTASKFGCPYVRVLADRNPAPEGEIKEEILIQNLINAADYAAEKKISLLIETNGVYCDSDRILNLIQKVDKSNLFIIWDIHHTYRFAGELPHHTVKKIGHLIKHVHLKDSISENGKIVYKLLGDGNVPITDAIKCLKHIGYKGFLCLEWVKRWAADIAEPGIAFPAFIYYIKEALNRI